VFGFDSSKDGRGRGEGRGGPVGWRVEGCQVVGARRKKMEQGELYSEHLGSCSRRPWVPWGETSFAHVGFLCVMHVTVMSLACYVFLALIFHLLMP
jgi:hypothetical protein